MSTYNGFVVFQWSTYDLALAQCDTFVNSNNSKAIITVTISNGTLNACIDDPYILVTFIFERI